MNKNFDFDKLSPEEKELLEMLGLSKRLKREGEFFQIDESPVLCHKKVEGLEMLPIKEALKKYDWLSDYYGRLFEKKDEFIDLARKELHNGFFVRVLPGYKVIYPVQACLYIRTKEFSQKVYNIVIVEEGAELNLITSCAVHPHVSSAFHIGVSEYYVKKGGKLTYTMIHKWGKDTVVKPRTAVKVEEGGMFVSTYVNFSPVKNIQSSPICYLSGRGAKASFISVIANYPDSYIDLGGNIYFQAPETSGEIISRTVLYGGENIARSRLVALSPKVKGHVECEGLMLSEKGVIRSIPELESHHRDVELTHEAAVGKIAQEEVEYLMARGLSEKEAVSLIVKGFLSVKIKGLPPQIEKEIEKITRQFEIEGSEI